MFLSVRNRLRHLPPPAERLEEDRDDAHTAHHLSIHDAEDLLDWLEGQGIHANEVRLDGDGHMSVSWAA
jgi:hypothetical protein